MSSPFLITFAGMVGTGKSTLAHHLSWNLKLPIFSTDSVRSQVAQDLGRFDPNEYLLRRDQSLTQLIRAKTNFILDASVDREWQHYHQQLAQSGYRAFIISLDYNPKKIRELYQAGHYTNGLDNFDKYHTDHQQFLAAFSTVVNLSLTNADFPQRLPITLKACQQWLTSL
jgi:predicted kinase